MTRKKTRRNTSASSKRFQLLRLKHEIQDDAKVLKPVVDEVDVLRLCRSLGMPISKEGGKTSSHKFEFGRFDASDYDADFARFVRDKIFARRSGLQARTIQNGQDRLEIRCLFGKQCEVKAELIRMDLFGSDYAGDLRSQDQGVYCLDQSDDGESSRQFIVFSWLNGELFAPECIRETPAFVLRFLMSLSTNITCCLSQEDFRVIESEVQATSDSTRKRWNSYSVAFRVQKQEEQSDSISCGPVTRTSIPHANQAKRVEFVGGIFPALTVESRVPSTTEWYSRYDYMPLQNLVDWFVEKHKRYAVRLPDGPFHPAHVRDNVLEKFDRFPGEKLQELQHDFHTTFENDKVQISSEAFKDTRKFFETVVQKADLLFDIRCTKNSTQMDDAILKFGELMGWFGESGVLGQLDGQMRTMLYLPERLQTNMKLLDNVFRNQRSTFDEVLEAIISDIPFEADDGSSGSIWRVLEDATWGALYWWSGNDQFSRGFQRRMEQHQISMKNDWVNVIKLVMPTVQMSVQDLRVHQYYVELQTKVFLEQERIKDDAFDSLRVELRSCNRQFGAEITRMRLSADKTFASIEWSEEFEKEPSKVIYVYQLGDSRGDSVLASQLGTMEFEPGTDLRKVATVKTNHLIAIVVKDGNTFVRLIQFPLESGSLEQQKATQSDVRIFPHTCSLCCIQAHDRRVAFAFGDSTERLGKVAVYRFNALFTNLEMTSSVDLDTAFHLAAPLTSILLTERSLYAVNVKGELQSYDTRSRQTSKKVLLDNTKSKDEYIWVSDLLSLADELVVGRARIEGKDQLSVHSNSTEDNRNLPTVFFDKAVGSKKVVVGCLGDRLYVVNADTGIVHSTELHVTVRSDAYRIQRSCGGQSLKSKRRGYLQVDGKANSTTEHWLRVFYHVFEKFPVRSLIEEDVSSEDSFHFELGLAVLPATGGPSSGEVVAIGKKYFQNVMVDLQRLNKPLFGVELEKKVWSRSSELADDTAYLQSRSIRSVLMAVVTFLPVQICRAEDNMLKLLQDGKVTSLTSRAINSSEAKGTEASDIAQSLRFGLLSPLLESWSGRCVVATSMGKQSTGKSYFLNHLTGTSFAMSGSRCTDGAWMSVRIMSPDVLLVVLDFEGLGSFERSEQEDIFLSVLNAAVSLFTVFRMETRFDKDIDGLFSRFQKGVQLIKNDLRLFRGLLYMSVKDVNMNDRQGVVDELVGKLDTIFESNREQNFLTEMYSGQLEINCSPPFGTVEYYQCMENDAANTLRDIITSAEVAKGFTTGKAFLDCLRIVLAKISILDWTSMDQSTQKLLVADVERKLPGILRTGCHVPQCAVNDKAISLHLKEDVMKGGSREKMVIPMKEVGEEYPEFAMKWEELNELVQLDDIADEAFDVGFDVTATMANVSSSAQKMLVGLFQQFLEAQNKRYAACRLFTEDQSAFDEFVAFVLRRRKMKVSRWLRSILGDHLKELRVQLEQRFVDSFVIRFSRCQHKCTSCQLGCMRTMTHSVELKHDCCTDHTCRGHCEYAECQGGSDSGQVPFCSRGAGHEGKCECEKGEHTCGQQCFLAQAPNCDHNCSKLADHEGDHRCSVQLHVCGVNCSAISCSGTCLLNIQRKHSVHKCSEVQCLRSCLMDGCKASCGVKDHFHGQPNESRTFACESGVVSEDNGDTQTTATHMCGGSHACSKLCEVDGICEQKVHLKKSSRTYEGARGSFEYIFQEMNGCKKQCALVIPSGLKDHEGVEHSCAGHLSQRNEEEQQTPIHYCDVRCPCCDYFCNKEFGHMGLHATSHGNMRQTYFMAKGNDVDIEDRKYQVGERGIAEMCNLFCSKMGRGHAHYLACEGNADEKCVYTADASKDQRRHCTDDLYPPPDKAMDELLHAKFWSTIGWEDPCSEEECALFAKCPFQCNAPEHDEEGNSPSYCVLDAWHLPELKPAAGDDGFAYVDGHKFECVHVVDSGKFHNIFVLDSSGSMSGQPWQDLVCACNEFVINRQQAGGENDLVSYVTFDHESTIQCEGELLSETLQMVLPYSGGGTCFTEGLRAANEVLSRNNFEEFKAVLMFFSDGRPWDFELAITLAKHIRSTYAKYDLKAFVVGFGCMDLAVLHRVAAEMGGEYRQVLDANALKTEFERIAAILCNSEASLALLEPNTGHSSVQDG